ncbi:unnamed protein product [Allacma fusca]|uniref:Uncharacterized protein n=1 Tax=Allacma fusca TaxID=39272 RepID=A0A8J2KRD8_9HEXA|nr:unnamed protein product [Allacma fusca]
MKPKSGSEKVPLLLNGSDIKKKDSYGGTNNDQVVFRRGQKPEQKDAKKIPIAKLVCESILSQISVILGFVIIM